MQQKIIFLSPEEIAGLPGFQVVDDESHEVTGVTLEDGTPVNGECSYKGIEYA